MSRYVCDNKDESTSMSMLFCPDAGWLSSQEGAQLSARKTTKAEKTTVRHWNFKLCSISIGESKRGA